MKSLKYCENYHNVTQRHAVSKCCWKNGAGRLLFVEITISLKHNKRRYAFIDSHAVVRNIAERSSVPFSTFPSGNLFQSCSAISQPGYSHWNNPLILFHFLSFISHLHVCMWACVFSSLQFCYMYRLLYPPPQWRYITVSSQGSSLLSFYHQFHLFPSYFLTLVNH